MSNTETRSVRELVSTLATDKEKLDLLVIAVDALAEASIVDHLYAVVETQKASPAAAALYDTADAVAAGGDTQAMADSAAEAKEQALADQAATAQAAEDQTNQNQETGGAAESTPPVDPSAQTPEPQPVDENGNPIPAPDAYPNTSADSTPAQ